ncbi:MAG: hypothetical protein ACYDC0_16325 [Acidimicrobiales bacterium]
MLGVAALLSALAGYSFWYTGYAKWFDPSEHYTLTKAFGLTRVLTAPHKVTKQPSRTTQQVLAANVAAASYAPIKITTKKTTSTHA